MKKGENTSDLYLHGGELLESEFQAEDWMPSFVDVSFKYAQDALYKIVSATLIEWLRRGGNYTPTIRKRSRSPRR